MAVYTSSPTQQMQCIFTNIQNNPPHISHSLSLSLFLSVSPPSHIHHLCKCKKTLWLCLWPSKLWQRQLAPFITVQPELQRLPVKP